MKRLLVRKWLIAVMALLLISSAAPATFTSTTHATGIAYRISSANDPYEYLTVSGGTHGALVQQYSLSNSDYQKWYLEDLGNGYYNIRNVGSGDLMDVSGASTSDGANVIQWPDNGGLNQQWQLIIDNGPISKGDGREIKNRNSGKLLDMSGQSTSDGGQAIQWTANGGSNQIWFLQPS